MSGRRRGMVLALLVGQIVACAQPHDPATGDRETTSAATPAPAEPDQADPATAGDTGAPEAAPDASSAPASNGAVATPTESTPPAAPPPAPWVATYDWQLEIEGAPSYESSFFQEYNSTRLLILAPGMDDAALLDQTGQKILALPRRAITMTAEGEGAEVPPGAVEAATVSTYTLDQSRRAVIFYLDGRRLKIVTRQPLVGSVSLDEILTHSPIYRKGIDEYTPAAPDIASLRAHRGPIRIEVFFGTWCPHCKVVVPKFMKTMAEAANPDLQVTYIGVPRQFATYPEARAKGVRSVPAMIFYRDGVEFGRLPAAAGDTIEGAVTRLLATSSAAR